MKRIELRLLCLMLCAAMLLPLIPAEAGAKAPVSVTKEKPEAAVTEEADELEEITDQGSNGYQHTYSFQTFEDLKTLCAKTYMEETRFHLPPTGKPLIITENLTLPANVSVRIEGELQIAKGVTFSTASSHGGEIDELVVNGVFSCNSFFWVRDKLAVNGKLNLANTINLYEDAVISGFENIHFANNQSKIVYVIDTTTQSELFEALAKAKADTSGIEYAIRFYAAEDFTFSESFTVPGNTELIIGGTKTCTVPSGKTMTVSGTVGISSWDGSNPTLKIAGKLVNNNFVSIEVGTLEDPIISFTGSGVYSGSGTIKISFYNGVSFLWDDVVTGLDAEDLDITEGSNWYRIRKASNLTKLSAPKNPAWSTTQKGTMNWYVGEVRDISSEYQYYSIKLYKDDALYKQWTNGWTDYYDKNNLPISLDAGFDWSGEKELVSGTYYFTVQAIPNPNASNSKYRASDTVTSSKWTYTKPAKYAKPTNLKMDWPTVTWTGPSGSDYYYHILVMVADKETDTPTGTCSRFAYEPSYTFTKQDMEYLRDCHGDTYVSIKVRAISNDITKKAHSSWSTLSEAYFFDGFVGVEPPTLNVSNVASTGKIKLTWNKMEGAAKYEIYRATSKTGTYTKLSTVTGTSLTNSSAPAGKTYYYKVRSVGADGSKSDWSNIVSRTCDLPRPTVSVTNVASTGKIKLTWNKVDGAVKYEVYRATSKNGTYSKLSTVTGTSLTNGPATVGKIYYYKVKAIHSTSSANSAYSPVVSRTCDLPRPEVSVTNVASSGKIKVSWEKIDGATKYEVYRATSKDGTYSKLITTTGTSITNTSAKAGQAYYYKVRAIHSNSAANSAYSEIKYRTCDLARPEITVKRNSNGDPKVTWEKISGATKYQVYVATSKNGTYKLLKTVTGTSLTHGSSVAGKTYYYKVRAVHSNSAATSAFSTIKTCVAR